MKNEQGTNQLKNNHINNNKPNKAMSYYLLPYKNAYIEIAPRIYQKESCNQTIEHMPYICPSLQSYLCQMNQQILTLVEERGDTIEFLQTLVNPYQYIFSKVPDMKNSVGKMRPFSASFYIFYEIFSILGMMDNYNFKNRNIQTILCSPHSKSMSECIDIFRENYQDVCTEVSIEEWKNNSWKGQIHSIDFFYFEWESVNSSSIEENWQDSLDYMILFLNFLLNYQNRFGNCIVKVGNMIYKPMLEILFLLTSFYEKVYIIKPNASNVCKNEKFIVCKTFLLELDIIYVYLQVCKSLIVAREKKQIIESILKNDLPYYFLNKIEEANIIIGHQQLEAMEQIIHLLKGKNKDDKMEILKKNHIQKCIQWCEKYKIPYNKFSEKVNIFLNQNQSLSLSPNSNLNLVPISDVILDHQDQDSN